MKELTSILTVQITFIGTFDDERAERLLETKEERDKFWLEQLKTESPDADDVMLLDSKLFVADKEA